MPGVGIGILIFNSSKKILLILRNEDAKKADSMMRLEGTWTLPAGKVKLNETLIAASKRKAKEEVNLDISNIEVISIADDINGYAHFVTVGLFAKNYVGNVDLGKSDEHVAYDWFDINDLPDNLCEPSKKIINNYLDKIIYRGEE